MKIKIFALILCLAVSSLFVTCCSKEDPETTAPEFTWPEPETERSYTLDEMSPVIFNTEFSADAELNINSYNLSDFEYIDAKDSSLKETQAKKILKNGKTELFYMEEEQKVFIILLDSEGIPEYSGSYKSDTGSLEFIGNSNTSWYFDENEELYTVVYTFSVGAGYKGIASFYNPDGTRDMVIAAEQYYDGDLNVIPEDEIPKYLQKYAKTTELLHK